MNPTRDWCTFEGANEIQARIVAYWEARGFQVKTSVVRSCFTKEMREAPFYVRSDMRNGKPAGDQR